MNATEHQPTLGQKRRRRRFLRVLLVVFGILLAWAGGAGWLAWSLRGQLTALQTTLADRPLSAANAAEACSQTQQAGVTARRLRVVALPVRPLLRRLGGLGSVGPALAAAPALSDLGLAGSRLADQLCTVLAPAFPALDLPAESRLAAALPALQAAPIPWTELRAKLADLAAAWQTLPAQTWAEGSLSRFQPQAAALSAALASADEALSLVEALWPAAPTLAGTGEPLALLVLGQNPLELRATGGFVGSLGTLTISQGRIANLSYHDSSLFSAAAPAGSEFPLAYATYLRASQWFLRDANWWPDFARSARTLETFWELNEQPPVQGVVAVDLYALQGVLQAVGPVAVPGYGVVTGTTNLESIYQFYEAQGGATAPDKGFLKALFQATLARVQSTPQANLPAVLAALKRAFDERHISVQLHADEAQAAFASRHWDGEVRAFAGDYLQVVDSDLSYSDAQELIEQQLALELAVGSDGAPLTHTLTLTYTNQYDPWRASQTRHQFNGYCFDPALGRSQRVPGCYGDYVRLVLPATSAPLALSGADSPLRLEADPAHSVLGFYLLLYPGQTQTISLTYRVAIPLSDTYRLLIQKQAGTIARPLSLVIQPAHGPTQRIQTDLWRDRDVALGRDGQLLAGDLAPLHLANTPEHLAASRAWHAGWQLWQAGATEAALGHWQATGTLERALDQVVGLRSAGDIDQAGRLWAALAAVGSPSPRLTLLGAQLARDRGDTDSARRSYEQVLAQAPTSDVARMGLIQLALDQADSQQAAALARQLRDPLAELRRSAMLAFFEGDPTASAINRLILNFAPADRVAWDQLFSLAHDQQPVDSAALVSLTTEAQAVFPGQALWFRRRAEAYGALKNPALALADWRQTTAFSPTDDLAWYQQGIAAAETGDVGTGVAAIERAIQLNPQPVAYHLTLGGYYLTLGRRAEARAAYVRAAEADPANPAAQELLRQFEP